MCTVAFAKARNNCSSTCSGISVAYAQDTLAICCALSSPIQHSAALATALESFASVWRTLVNAHTTLASPCGLDSSTRCSIALANAPSRSASEYTGV
eukprot:gnl/TRDRNA2_/TRDRNA2_153285_c0_seq2.p2 gnl/TRDRNA2_/TRDRNA2_153285_c0~~gnl/TRDRNA2_/TRDRNA2_153285_c0_seq2.p2  ORF type:complete len:111 (-),score=0.60 gnl/TRDRNA2_/TRDRNA2_153285_c0_seq2:128-418(-)